MRAAVLLLNPKYPHNVAQSIRACAAYGVDHLRYTGLRLQRELEQMKRIPREERMRGYSKVNWSHSLRPFNEFKEYIPICVELHSNSESLPHFEHPENALYVFGPEDGHINQVARGLCHRFVSIPTDHCINLSMAVGTVLYDRRAKLQPDLLAAPVLYSAGYSDE